MAKATSKAAPKKAAPKKAASKSSASKSSASEESMLQDLFVEELKDIYYAEKHLSKAMPKMRKGATSQELAGAFETHLAQTAEQIARIEEVFGLLEKPVRAKKCDAMEGLVKEAQSVLEDTPKGSSVRDVALIIQAQKIEHYEIASYGSLVQLAKTMGRTDIAEVLQVTLDEEKQTDVLLTELAESGINISADNETED